MQQRLFLIFNFLESSSRPASSRFNVEEDSLLYSTRTIFLVFSNSGDILQSESEEFRDKLFNNEGMKIAKIQLSVNKSQRINTQYKLSFVVRCYMFEQQQLRLKSF